MKTIFCLSGLGADERIFKQLNVPNVTLQHLPWLSFSKNETMETYAIKMTQQISEENPIILGLSFGGMLAVEISKAIKTHKTFLISSAKSQNELPDMSSFLVFMLKSGLVPYSLFKQPNKILFEKFGAETQDEKALLTAVLKNTSTDYLREAFKIILNWKNETTPTNIIHIHGTHDKIISPDFVNPDYWIPNGSHMMVWNKADEIARIISVELGKNPL